MCGFVALFEKGRSFSSELTDTLENDIFHRGPDSGGQYKEDGCALIFRRLAILDIAEHSNQPMHFNDYVIVFNGEIYNYTHLRDTLKSKGFSFKTTSDTEVLLKGYVYWGVKVVEHLEGMFAFVVWNKKTKTVYAARDHLGIKPLYIAQKDNFVGFASEIRPLRRMVGTVVDEAALSELLIYKYSSGEFSNYKNIKNILPGTYLTLDSNTGKVLEQRYFDISNTFEPDYLFDEKSAIELATEQLENSVSAHMQSDVGYGVQLSGGIDSSLIAAIANHNSSDTIRSYGISLNGLKQDETVYRQLVVDKFNLKHININLTNNDLADALPKAIAHLESPTAHFGCVFLMILSQEISKTDKVILTGEGADELFGGYSRYGDWRQLRRYGQAAKLLPNFYLKRTKRYSTLLRYKQHDAAVMSSVYTDSESMKYLFPDIEFVNGYRDAIAKNFNDFRDRMMAIDQNVYLSSLLDRQDKMSMAASVEARVPFVHLPLYKAMNRIPREIRIPGNITKPLLKKIAESWFPSDFVHRRKVGLTLPLVDWANDNSGLGRYKEYINEPNSRIAEYADKKRLTKFMNNYNRQNNSIAANLPHLINMELWLRSHEK